MSVYARHAALSDSARPTAALPRLILGVALIEALYAAARGSIDALLTGAKSGLAVSYYYGDTPQGLLFQLSSFGFLIAATILVARWGHGRGLFALIGDFSAFKHDLIKSFLWVMALMLAMEAIPPWWDMTQIDHFRDTAVWLALLLPALVALLIQTGAEELLYRGYIQSQLAARFSHPLVWMGLPSALFAAVHWDNGATPIESAQYTIWAFLFGLAAADLTARTGNLGAALGLHLANNAFAFLLFAEVEGPDSGLALALFTPGALSGNGAPMETAFLTFPFFLELCGVGLMWLAARLTLPR